jgi:hypothetical protein
MSRKDFLRIRFANLFRAKISSSPILQEGILIARGAIASLGRKLRAKGAEHFHHAGVRQERG